eukprot:14949458-Heterocapsa_arctica.AAC.1
MDGGITNAGASETALRSDLPDDVVNDEEPTDGGLPVDIDHGTATTNLMHQIPTSPDSMAAAIRDFDDFRAYHPRSYRHQRVLPPQETTIEEQHPD